MKTYALIPAADLLLSSTTISQMMRIKESNLLLLDSIEYTVQDIVTTMLSSLCAKKAEILLIDPCKPAYATIYQVSLGPSVWNLL